LTDIIRWFYLSRGDDAGECKCTLPLKSTDNTNKNGDEIFELESSDDDACEWNALGIPKSYPITAKLATNSGAPAVVKISFPLGPSGSHIEVTTIDLDRTLGAGSSFRKQEKRLTGAD